MPLRPTDLASSPCTRPAAQLRPVQPHQHSTSNRIADSRLRRGPIHAARGKEHRDHPRTLGLHDSVPRRPGAAQHRVGPAGRNTHRLTSLPDRQPGIDHTEQGLPKPSLLLHDDHVNLRFRGLQSFPDLSRAALGPHERWLRWLFAVRLWPQCGPSGNWEMGSRMLNVLDPLGVRPSGVWRCASGSRR
jgi:hypothetical protein